MVDAKQDENRVPVIVGVSTADQETIVPIQVDPTNWAIKWELV